MDIAIKDKDILRGLMERRYAPILIDIICFVAEKYGFVMTESYRDKLHKNDLHGTIPVRAIDLREWYYKPGKAAAIEAKINSMWEYDPRRPDMTCAYIHKNRKAGPDGTFGLHFHIQVHPNTRIKR